MVTSEELEAYLLSVPALPQSVRETLDALREGELAKAAKAAAKDKALLFYLQKVVNSAAYGFRQRLSDANQIFSALGVQRAKQLLYAYMVSITAPKAWHYFKIDADEFMLFQADMMHHWEMLIEAVNAHERYLSAAALVCAALVVADAIFGKRAEDVALIRAQEAVSLDTILQKVAKMNFEELVLRIAQKWETEEDVQEVVHLAFGHTPCQNDQPVCQLGKLLHLLLFYELSRPAMMKAGANDFLTFHPEFSEEVVELFERTIMGDA